MSDPRDLEGCEDLRGVGYPLDSLRSRDITMWWWYRRALQDERDEERAKLERSRSLSMGQAWQGRDRQRRYVFARGKGGIFWLVSDSRVVIQVRAPMPSWKLIYVGDNWDLLQWRDMASAPLRRLGLAVQGPWVMRP